MMNRNSKHALFAVLSLLCSFVLIEAFVSWALVIRMRFAGAEAFTKTEPSYLSVINVPYKAGVRLGLFPDLSEFEFRSESAPGQVRSNVFPTAAWRLRVGAIQGERICESRWHTLDR